MKQVISLLIGALICTLPPPLAAATIEVFLNAEHRGKIENLDKARIDGDTLVYYFLDTRQRLESQVNEVVKQALQPSLDRVMAAVPKAELQTLTEEAIGQLVAKSHQEHSTVDLAAVIQSVMDADYLDALNQAAADEAYAADKEITDDQLPAIIAESKIYPNVEDYHSIRGQ